MRRDSKIDPSQTKRIARQKYGERQFDKWWKWKWEQFGRIRYNDLIKQLGYKGQNFDANITNSNQGTEFGINALLKMFGGEASVGAYKNPEDQGLQFLFNKSF